MKYCLAASLLLCMAACDRERGSSTAIHGDAAASTPAAGSETEQTCTRSGARLTGPLKIAVIPGGSTHEFWKAIHAGALKAQLECKDVQIEWKGPMKEDDRNDQINVVENFITARVDGIALAPLDNVALVRPIRDAMAAGIGVVVMDGAVKADVCKHYASFVATDSYVGGSRGAQRLGEVLGGKGKVMIMRYPEGSIATAQREQGFLDTLAERFPGIQMISSDQRGGSTTEASMAVAENLLNKFRDVDGIFTPNESTTFGMLLALQATGRAGRVKFVGFDSSEKLIQGLEAGQLHGLVLQDPVNMGYLAVKTVVAYLRGEPVPTRLDTGSAVATPENMNEPRMKELLRPPIEQYLR